MYIISVIIETDKMYYIIEIVKYIFPLSKLFVFNHHFFAVVGFMLVFEWFKLDCSS